MKGEEGIVKMVNDHERRITRLESLLGKDKGTAAKMNTGEQMKLTDYIISARDSKFFSRPKTAEETQKKLQETYHCDTNRIAVALLRLANRRLLRRTTKVVNGKKYQAYAW